MERYQLWILLAVLGGLMVWCWYADNIWTSICHQYAQMTIDHGLEVDYNYMMACIDSQIWRPVGLMCSTLFFAIGVMLGISYWKEKKHKK